MDEEIKGMLSAIQGDLKRHAQESRDRETRLVNRVEEVAAIARRAESKADLAHAAALQAKRDAGQVSIDAEGNDHNLFAELGSLKVVMAEHTKALGVQKEEQDKQKKMDAKARKFWRLAQPALIAAVLAALNQFANMLGPKVPASILPPQTVSVDGGK